MKEIEQREGKPIQHILKDLYARMDGQKSVAAALGISQPTLSLWLVRVGLKEKTVLVERGQER